MQLRPDRAHAGVGGDLIRAARRNRRWPPAVPSMWEIECNRLGAGFGQVSVVPGKGQAGSPTRWDRRARSPLPTPATCSVPNTRRHTDSPSSVR